MTHSTGESSFGYHRAATLQTCQRRYAFRYGLRLEPHSTNDALALGSLLHLALMNHYLKLGGFDAQDPTDAMMRAPRRIAHRLDAALRIWPAYLAWAKTEDHSIKVLDVEREYEAKVWGKKITCRLDLVFASNGKVRAMDHKSSSGDLRYVAKDYADGGQLPVEEAIGEAVLPSMYGLEWDGVWINAISTVLGNEPVALRQRVRIEPRWRDSVMQSLSPVLFLASQIEDRADWGTVDGAFATAGNAEACKDRWGKCPYFDLCREGPSFMDSAAFPFDRIVDEASTLRESAGR